VNVHLKLLSPEAFFSPKCTKYCLAAGLRPDPLGEITALPQTPYSCIKGCLFLREGRGGGGEKGVGREGGICVIGFRGVDATAHKHTQAPMNALLALMVGVSN